MDQKTSVKARRGGSGRLPADEAARLPDRLLDAAIAVFLDQGYAQTTMDRIVRAAGASTKTVYGRYRNKNEIIMAAVRRLMDRSMPSVLSELETTSGDDDPRATLTLIGERLALLATEQEALGLYRLVVAESPRFPNLAELYGEGSGRVVAMLGLLMKRWQRVEKLTFDGKPEQVAQAFLDLVIATPRNRAVIGTRLSRAALKSHIGIAVDLFLRGYGPEGR